jgi:hypothetical protein
MRIMAFAATILIAANVQALAQAKSGKRNTIGYGTSSCKSWTEERAKANSLRAHGMKAWAVGFVSGANLVTKRTDFLESVDAEALWKWIDKFCRAHPLERFLDAAIALTVELDSKVQR